jgi:hypothetical protein
VITISTLGFKLPVIALQSTYNLTADEITKIQKYLPSSPGLGVEDCLKRCNK